MLSVLGTGLARSYTVLNPSGIESDCDMLTTVFLVHIELKMLAFLQGFAQNPAPVVAQKAQPSGGLVKIWPGENRPAFLFVDGLMSAAIARVARSLAALAARKVFGPLSRVLGTELVQVLPRIKPGTVAVIEHQPHGVVADRLHRLYADVLLADDQRPPPPGTRGPRRGRVNPEVFERQLKALAVGK